LAKLLKPVVDPKGDYGKVIIDNIYEKHRRKAPMKALGIPIPDAEEAKKVKIATKRKKRKVEKEATVVKKTGKEAAEEKEKGKKKKSSHTGLTGHFDQLGFWLHRSKSQRTEKPPNYEEPLRTTSEPPK